MRNHITTLVAVAEKSVIDVDVSVTGVLKSTFDDKVGLMNDYGVGNIDHIGIPRAPAHKRRLHCLRLTRGA